MNNILDRLAYAKLYNLRYYNDNVSKIYFAKISHYGSYIDVIEYKKIKLSFKSDRLDYVKKLQNSRRHYSLSRARQNIYRLVEANVFRHGAYKPIFATLTFKQNIESLREANQHYKYFIKKLNDYVGYNVKYVAVPEFQRRGAVHYHIVFFNLHFIDRLQFESLWSHGFTNIGYADSNGNKINNVSAYLSKYLSKDTADKRLYGQRSYFTSRGLFHVIHTFDYSYIDTILLSNTMICINSYENGDFTLRKFRLIKK